MKPQHDFVAERALAQHCPELLPPAQPQRDLLADCSAFAQEIARELALDMMAVASGGPIKVICGETSRVNTTAFINKMGRDMAHCVIAAADKHSLLFSTDHRAVHVLTDRAYGGTGEAAEKLPDELPLSAQLTLRQLQESWCGGLSRMLPHAGEIAIARCGAELGRLDPFRGQAECAHLEMTVKQDGHEPWTIMLSGSIRDLERWLDCHGQSSAKDRPVPAPNDPLAAPFGDIALPARAILAEKTLSLAQISTLRIGDVIPLSVPREVPLMIGNRAVARGSVGSFDDRVALQITQQF